MIWASWRVASNADADKTLKAFEVYCQEYSEKRVDMNITTAKNIPKTDIRNPASFSEDMSVLNHPGHSESQNSEEQVSFEIILT